MPRSETCFATIGGKEKKITAEEAVEMAVHRGRCIECGQPVRTHRSGGHTKAHFEHLKRNPTCSRSYSF